METERDSLPHWLSSYAYFHIQQQLFNTFQLNMSSEDFLPLQTPRFRLTEQVKFLLIYQSVYVVLMSLCCFIKRKQMETTSMSTILSTSFLKREAQCLSLIQVLLEQPKLQSKFLYSSP